MRSGGDVADAVDDLRERAGGRGGPWRRAWRAADVEHERQQRERRGDHVGAADADEHDPGECAGECRRDDTRAVHAQHRQRDRVAELLTADDLGGEGHPRRAEEAERDSLGDGRDEQHPELDDVGEHHDAHTGGCSEDRSLAHDQHPALRESIGGDATERGGDQQCDAEAEIDEPERTFAFGEVPCQHPAEQELHLHGHERERSGPPQLAVVEVLERREGALESRHLPTLPDPDLVPRAQAPGNHDSVSCGRSPAAAPWPAPRRRPHRRHRARRLPE